MNTWDYKGKINNLLDPNTYKELNKDPTDSKIHKDHGAELKPRRKT